MVNDKTAELVLTADGAISNIIFVEELVAAAPKIDNWMFTALKPASDIENFNINMGNYNFGKENLCFYFTQDDNFPDEIDITVVHEDLNSENKQVITNGTLIFLDNYIGELNFATTIDRINVVGKEYVTNELVPIAKLKDFLIWREKEFLEKYDGIRHNTKDDKYNMLEGTLKNGNPILAVINTDLLNWDSKASHPWILRIDVKFAADKYGLPNKTDYELLDNLEDNLLISLKDSEGYLNIGRETAEGLREIYFACKDFRKPSKILHQIKSSTAFELTYEIYKDKYWQSVNRFTNN